MEEGEKVLLFLKDLYNEGYYKVAYGMQGKFIIDDDTAYNSFNRYKLDELINIIKKSLNR